MKAALGLSLGFCAMAIGYIASAGTTGGQAVDAVPTSAGDISIIPINHATLALKWNGKTILADPVGDRNRFANLSQPDIILLTDIHGDHFNKEVLTAVSDAHTKLVAPAAVADQLTAGLREHTIVLTNGAKAEIAAISIEAIPAYNLTPDRVKFHSHGRGNGYVLTLGGRRVYISGDTEDIPEMLALKDIDVAFLCMNLPYTMDVDQAARAVRAFKPKIVYPYHCRGSDLKRFKELVGTEAGVEARLRDWYAGGRM